MSATLLRGGWLVTMNKSFADFRGDLLIEDGAIAAIGRSLKAPRRAEVVDASNCFVIPGLIQAHVHLCQTLFRGLADDLELLDWLKTRIWPLEQALDAASLRASARLGLMEMQLLGTTSILDMGTVRLHEVVFAEAERSGMRYWGGNCLMDEKTMSGPLHRPTDETLAYCERLIRDWHLKTPLLQYAISPRFALSCTEKILKAAAALRDRHGLIYHTHAAENRGEIAAVRRRFKTENMYHLHACGALSSRTVVAHGIHMNAREIELVRRTKTGICHCPGSNLKLASGVARIDEYRRRRIKLALGADGAACNNALDPFREMRLAALLQKPLAGPRALPARRAFELATRGGAQVLGASKLIGSLEVGKRADVVLVDRTHPSVATVDDPYSALVYSCSGRDVRDVWIDGRPVVRARRHLIHHVGEVTQTARRELRKLLRRARITRG